MSVAARKFFSTLRSLAVLPWVLTGLAVFAAPAAAGVALSQTARIALDPAAASLEGEATVTLEGMGTAWLTLGPAFALTSVAVDGAAYPLPDGPLGITVDGTRRVVLAWRGTLAPMVAAGRGSVTGAPMAGEAGAFLPTGSGWLPSDRGAPFAFHVTVTVPPGYRAVMPGRLDAEAPDGAGGGYRATFASERPMEGPVLVAGRYEVRERIFEGLRLRTYFEAEVAALADDYLDATAAYIARYSDWIGPYPYSAFHVVSGPLPVGLGYPGLTYIGTRVLKLPFIRETSLGHEVLHNWWGNGVAPDYARGNWAEGLTTFMADYTYALDEGPDAAREQRFAWLRDYHALPPARDQAAIGFVYRQHGAAQVVGYNKVAFVFHMLRREIGSPAFDAGVRKFWREHRHQTADWDALRRAFEASSGHDLQAFFDQWLLRKGAPTLALKKAKAEPDASGWRLHLALAQTEPAYQLSVPVDIVTDRGVERRTVDLASETRHLTFKLADRPRAVTVDPDGDIFRHLHPEEAPPILRDVTLDPQTRVVLPDQDDAARGAATQLAAAMMDAPPEPGDGRDEQWDRQSPLLLVGTAETVAAFLAKARLPSPPPQVAGRGTAQAWATRTPTGRPAVVVAAKDAAALAALVRPLPHYGRRGYVVFDGAAVVDKGGWPARGGPLSRPVE